MIKMLKQRKLAAVLVLTGFFLVAAVSSGSAEVTASGPQITFADAGKTLSTGSPVLVVTLASSVKLDNTGYGMTLDGNPISSTFEYKGHWEPVFEEDPYWVTDSFNDGRITGSPGTLQDGAHTLVVTAKDTLGNVTNSTFNFSIAQKPLISGFEPANGTTVNETAPVIKALIVDPNGPALDKSSIVLKIDGGQVAPVLTVATDGSMEVSFSGTTLSADTYHNVYLSVADTAAAPNTGIAEWSFYINNKGEMAVNAKSCGSCHALNQYDKFQHSEGPLGIGVGKSSPTHFYGRACSHCHGGYKEQTCGYCHNADISLWWDGEGWVRPQPEPNPALSAGQDCTYCHSGNNGGWVPSAYSADHFYWVNNIINTGVEPFEPLYPDLAYTLKHDILPLHKADQGICNNCHSTYLTREHNRNNQDGEQIACASCHSSTDKTVVRSVAAGNGSCAGCHNESKTHNIKLVGTVPDDIPLYPGFAWTAPMEAGILADDNSTALEYANGQVLLSDRMAEVTAAEIWNFYNNQLTADSWTPQSAAPLPGALVFSAVFVKDSRQVTVKCFNTNTSEGSGIPLAAGYRTAIWYK